MVHTRGGPRFPDCPKRVISYWRKDVSVFATITYCFPCGGDGPAEITEATGADLQEIESILKATDTDGDGEIDFDEFMAAMRNQAKVRGQASLVLLPLFIGQATDDTVFWGQCARALYNWVSVESEGSRRELRCGNFLFSSCSRGVYKTQAWVPFRAGLMCGFTSF